MDEISTVQILQSLCNLVDDVLLMLLSEDVLPDHPVEIGIHVLEYHIHILLVVRPEDVSHFDDVLVVELLQIANLPEGPLGISGMLECVEYFLERDYFVGLLVTRFPNMAIGP